MVSGAGRAQRILGSSSHVSTYRAASSADSGGLMSRGLVLMRRKPKIAGSARPISSSELTTPSHHCRAFSCWGRRR